MLRHISTIVYISVSADRLLVSALCMHINYIVPAVKKGSYTSTS